LNHINQFGIWVMSRQWVYAKTMPEHPHEYTAINRKRDDDIAILRFEMAVEFIRAQGVKRVFIPTKTRAVYLDFKEHRYWSMGWPVHMTTVVNRAKLSDCEGLHRLVKPRKPRAPKPT